MGLQYDRLVCEELKKYYVANFDKFRNIESVILDLLREKEQFVIGLHDNLKNKLSQLPNEGGTRQKEIFENELCSVFDERNDLRVEQAKKNEKFFPPPNQHAYQISKFRAEVLEQKLCLIEEELNNKGVIVKLLDGKVVFEDKIS